VRGHEDEVATYDLSCGVLALNSRLLLLRILVYLIFAFEFGQNWEKDGVFQ